MENRKRKALSDITNAHNLIPTSILRKLVANSNSNSNSISKPPPNRTIRSNSSSDSSMIRSHAASIGSSNTSSASRTVQFRTPPPRVISSSTETMGKKKSKSSRKGKKEWRANISTEDFEDYFEKSTKDALAGGSVADVSNESLFFVDKSRDLSVKRKIEKSREKVLRCDSVLQRNPFVQPIPSSVPKKKKSKKNTKTGEDDGLKDKGENESSMVDIWGEKGRFAKSKKKPPKSSIIPAVEVEHPGCSFNPHPESHQDPVARAVADEMQKIYQHELGPEPIPLIVPGEAMDEEKYFLEAGGGSDDDSDNEDPSESGDVDIENSFDLDEAGETKSSKSWTDPTPKMRKKRCSREKSPMELPQDFIQQQKAYFQDIDAFELQEEEASEDEVK